MGNLSFFAEEDRLEKLSRLGDSLEKLKVINWELYRPILNRVFEKERKSNAGRRPYDYVLLFKICILQRLFNLSDDQTEYQINDRISFMRFLGLTLSDKVPDAKTIWLFKETLSKAGAAEELFKLFGTQLENLGIITHKGTIVDATFVDAPRQRNQREENEEIKEGKTPENWKEETPEAKHKLAQKDTDGRWAKKGQETHFGYKDHVKVDADSKMITDYAATSASVHDSQRFTQFINETDEKVYADSAYAGKELADALPEKVDNQVHEKGYRNQPLTKEQQEHNRLKSKVRARIEHVFGFMTMSMNGITIRSIGLQRAEFHIGMMNLTYNMCRYAFLKRREAVKG